MKSGILSRCLTAAVLAGLSAVTYAEVKENPYQIIIDRNPFQLKTPPVVQPPSTEPTNAPPPIEIRLTGISDLLGEPKAFLQFQNQQTKKFEFPPALQVGEKQGDIEVLAIDTIAGTVRIRNGDAETTLDFEKNGVKPATAVAAAGSPVPPPPGMMPLRVPPPPAPGGSFNNPGAGNVSVSGGAPTTPTAGGPSFGANIPARPMRSEGNVLIGGGGLAANPNPMPQPQVHAGQSAEDVMRDIEARRGLMLQKEQAGQVPRGSAAILPPTKYTPPSPAQ
ncbi:MAG TPA: hypothetical protein VK530_09625 [Candidatus Acidoferrum sp.]|nr:hypothetical protein [Candidatus Acidoferrum sp.]